MAVDFKAGFHRLQDAVDDAGESKKVARISIDQDKFVASQAICPTVFRGECLDTLTDLGQQLVADGMTQCIVDVLETIQIEHRDAYRRCLVATKFAQVLQQTIAIGKTCELIEVSQCSEHFLGFVLFSHVAANDEKALGTFGPDTSQCNGNRMSIFVDELRWKIANGFALSAELQLAFERRHLGRRDEISAITSDHFLRLVT